MPKIPVLITAAGGGVGRQCLQALRLAKTDYKIIAADMSPESVTLYRADKAYLVPPAKDKNYLKKIFEICEKEKVKAVIPGNESEAINLMGVREKFSQMDILLLINSDKVIEISSDKWLTNKFLEENGFKFPKSYLPKNKKDVGKLNYPVIIKPASGGTGSKGVYLAQNKDEESFFVEYLGKQGLTAIVQEYIGTPEEEYTIGVLHSLEGEHMGTFVLKRLVHLGLSTKFSIKSFKNPQETYTISSGVSQGIVDDYPELARFAQKVAEKIGSRGPLNIQCRKSGKDIYLFEINPRFSGTTSIRALCGYNEPDALIQKHLLGKRVKMRYKKGLVLRDLENYFVDFKSYRAVQNKKR